MTLTPAYKRLHLKQFSVSSCFNTFDMGDVCPSATDTVQEDYLSNDSFSSSAETVLLVYPESKTSSWPQVFGVPHSSCFDEM